MDFVKIGNPTKNKKGIAGLVSSTASKPLKLMVNSRRGNIRNWRYY